MKRPTFNFTMRTVGYVIGGALVGLGVYGLAWEVLERKSSEDILFGYVLAGLFIAAGLLMCSAIRIRYAGGFWFSLGVVLLFGGVAGTTLELDDLFRRTQYQALRGILTAAVLVIFGSFCLFLGHQRHRRKHNDAV